MTMVLIADDEPGVRTVLRATISSEVDTILEAVDGAEAWQLLQQHRPPVALLDVRMPWRSGIELARAIRADPALADTKIIMLTASAAAVDVAAGLAAGADAYLTKPFSPLELLTTLDRVLGRL